MRSLKYYSKAIINLLLRKLNKEDKYYYTYHYRPKHADEVELYVPENFPNVGIVIQGPLKHEDDFTLETVKLYRKYYPKTPIIISTWDTEPESDIERIKAECGDIEFCISHFEKGKCSHNYQMISSHAGIMKARDKGCKYILKTRTDQRLYASGIISFLIQLMCDFPVGIDCGAKGRIITCSMCTFSDRLYNISDMVIFGLGDDVLRYFSCPADNRQEIEVERRKGEIVKEMAGDVEYNKYLSLLAQYSKLKTGEIWFASHYIESLGFKLKWTQEDSDYYRNNLFVILDDAIIDLYWPKYTDREYRWRNYQTKKSLHQVTFREWYMEQKHKL